MSQTNDNIDSVSLEPLRRQHSPTSMHDFFFFLTFINVGDCMLFWHLFQLCVLSLFSFFKRLFLISDLKQPSLITNKHTNRLKNDWSCLCHWVTVCKKGWFCLKAHRNLIKEKDIKYAKVAESPMTHLLPDWPDLFSMHFTSKFKSLLELECYLFLFLSLSLGVSPSETLCLNWLVGPHNTCKRVFSFRIC